MRGNSNLDFHIIANAAIGRGLSGGDRIFIECARRWAEKGYKITVYVWEEGYEMCIRNNLKNVEYVIWPASKYKKLGFVFLYLMRTVKGCIEAFRLKPVKESKNIVLYSASDFWPDVFPALIMKNKIKNAKWIAAFYLFAPSPLRGYSTEGRLSLPTLKGVGYYLSQMPVYWLIKKKSDMVFVTNELDRLAFIDNRLTSEKVVAVRGGVDAKTPLLIPDVKEKKYDAVFIGRLHPQKGVLELVEVWKYVCDKRKDAKLAIIGEGELEGKIREKIREYRLENNIDLLGFIDGIEKIKVFKASKIVVHPATYDSGGMAACEAMACGLPGVSFDLPALKTYYPKGMLKVQCYNLRDFADKILRLLTDEDLYEKVQIDALDWAKGWDWDNRATALLMAVKKLF